MRRRGGELVSGWLKRWRGARVKCDAREFAGNRRGPMLQASAGNQWRSPQPARERLRRQIKASARAQPQWASRGGLPVMCDAQRERCHANERDRRARTSSSPIVDEKPNISWLASCDPCETCRHRQRQLLKTCIASASALGRVAWPKVYQGKPRRPSNKVLRASGTARPRSSV